MALITCSNCGKQMSDKAKACPHCGTPAGQTASPAQPVLSTPEDEVRQKQVDELRNEQTALQGQVVSLREEATQLKDSISKEKANLEQLKSEIQVAQANLSSQKQAFHDIQVNYKTEKDKLDALVASVNQKQEELEKLTVQVDAINNPIKLSHRPSHGTRLFIGFLCIAIASTLAWIVWMVLNTNR